MRNLQSRRFLGAVIALGLVAPLGCQSWEQSKSVYVEDINELLHFEYARAHKTRDIDRISGLYADVARDEAWTERKQDLLDDFADLDRAYSRIVTLAPFDGGTAAARLENRVPRQGATRPGPLGVS